MTAPRAAIVIVAWGRRDITERCLDSLDRCLGATLGREIELVLVDNRSPDDTLELFDGWRDRATVIALPENRNFAGGCNAGAEAARGDVVVFLNNDTIVEPGILEALVDQAQAPGIAAAGLRLLYLDGTLQHAGVAMLRVPGGLPVPHHLFHHQPGDLPAARVSYELDVVTAACLAVRRDVFAEIGGYDTGYVNGWEDVDLCLRIRVAGHRIVYRGDLWLWHDEGRTRGAVRGADANAARFYGRWQSVLDADDELVRDVFGARLPETRPAPAPALPGRVVIHGPITGLTPAAAEARGLLRACAAAGLPVAAREPVGEMVWADLPSTELAEVRTALARPAASGAPVLEPALAQLPPCLPTGPPGSGGHGLLCHLPAHDLDVARRLLDAIAAAAPQQVRVLPQARSLPLLELIAQRLPAAEVLDPCTDEAGLRALAAQADVVLGDPEDPYERIGVLAAGAGATVVCRTGGRAHVLLGELTCPYDPADPGALASAIAGARGADAAARARCAQRIGEACSPEAVARVLLGRLAGTPVGQAA